MNKQKRKKRNKERDSKTKTGKSQMNGINKQETIKSRKRKKKLQMER